MDRIKSHVVLYARFGFGLVVLFALLGNVSGRREMSAFIVVITALMWVVLRIITEAIEAYATLFHGDKPSKKADKPKSDDTKGTPPPFAPA